MPGNLAPGLCEAPPAASSGAPLAVSVVVPVFHEAENIAATVQAITQSLSADHEILVVYDVEDDPTVPVVRELMAAYPRVALVKNHVARGPSGALRAGFAAARAPRVLVVMADGSDDLALVDAWLKLVPSQADIIAPSRYCRGGAQVLGPGSLRVKAIAPRLAGSLVKWVGGLPTVDPTNSFKLYSAEVLNSMRLTSTASFSVTLEIVAKAYCLGYRILEQPTVWRDRTHGQSKFPFAKSLATYLPWFGAVMLRNRLAPLPRPWLRRWFGVGRGAPSGAAAVHA